ncbi:hypothetical protein [Hoeflea sp.]|uniref:hypothetical protein n=1 Tax=Hoeflea sp. TaxID=1940281 RepID=UPI003748BF98
MNRFIPLTLLAFFAIVTSASADFVVPANKSTMIAHFAVWNPSTCAIFGKPSHKVRKQPQHGKLKFIYGVVKHNKIPAHCKGKVKGLQVIYTPDRGYRGPDNFVITVRQPRFLNDPAPRGQTLRPRFTVN